MRIIQKILIKIFVTFAYTAPAVGAGVRAIRDKNLGFY
jgi:hypothetical protein